MIVGLSHIGVTVSKIEDSLKYYQETMGFKMLSDAERKGEWVDKITGIPGFHTRTVYLAVTPHRHLEVFGFFNPKTIPPEKDGLKVGFLYCVFLGGGQRSFLPLAGTGQQTKLSKWVERLEEESYRGSPSATQLDPDELILRIIEARGNCEKGEQGLIQRFLYPCVIIENIEVSLHFFRDTLGLEIESRGNYSLEPNIPEGNGFPRKVRWALLKAPYGSCLQLLQPLDVPIQPSGPWQMQRIGFTHMAFGVKDLDAYYRVLAGKGVNFKSPPVSVTAGPHEGGKAVYLTSPDGITLEFIDSPLIKE